MSLRITNNLNQYFIKSNTEKICQTLNPNTYK